MPGGLVALLDDISVLARAAVQDVAPGAAVAAAEVEVRDGAELGLDAAAAHVVVAGADAGVDATGDGHVDAGRAVAAHDRRLESHLDGVAALAAHADHELPVLHHDRGLVVVDAVVGGHGRGQRKGSGE